MDKKVCVVIVTYNRKEYLSSLLNQLKNQTATIHSILIVDNFSSDGTDLFLKENNYIENIELEKLMNTKKSGVDYWYYRSSNNTGGAGGFKKAFELVKDLGYDYIWVMDDDVLPENDCLEKLLSYQSQNVMITIPNRTKNGFIDNVITGMNLSNPFKIFMRKKTIITADKLEEGIKSYEIVDMPFEGPLINTKLIDKVGVPDENYFLQFDDTDYATRSIKHTKIYFIVEAILEKQIIPSTKEKLDKKKLMNWKDYYAYRNDIIYCKKYGKNFMVKYITPVLLVVDLLLRAIYRRKFKNIKIILKAFKDGYWGNGGKTVEPGSI